MSRNGSGVYSLPAGNPVVTGTTISSTWANSTLSDIATALTQSIAYDGQTTPIANLPMGGYIHTGVGNATARTNYASAAQVEDGTLNYLTSVAGTNTITATAPISMSAYVAGQTFRFIAAGANTGAVTLNLNSIGAKSLVRTDGSALSSGDIASGAAVQVFYDGTNFQLLSDANGKTETVTNLTVTGNLTNSGLTSGRVTYATTGGLLTDSANLTYSGTTLSLNGLVQIDNGGNILGKSDNTGFVGVYGGGAYNAGAGIGLGGSGNGNANTIIFTRGAYVETARFDSSGNLGLGVTPSAWSSSGSTKVLQISTLTSFYQSFGGSNVGSNLYYDGTNNKYITSAYALVHSLDSTTGKYIWYTAPSGTAGNNITFTQAMTLDNSGNLGIGTNSPATPAHIYKSTASNTYFRAQNSLTSVDLGVDSAGTAIFYNNNNYPMTFGTNGSERMRIDSSGNLLVGTTSSSGTSVPGLKITDLGRTLTTVAEYNTSAQSNFIMYSTNAGAYRFYVGYDGVIHATSTSISAISDATLKENVKDLETGLTEVMALKPRRFDWKNGDGKNVAGFIAQEVEEILPDLVTESLYSQDEEGNDVYKKNLKMGDILPTLVKAIQEQQELIKQLQADVAALKAK